MPYIFSILSKIWIKQLFKTKAKKILVTSITIALTLSLIVNLIVAMDNDVFATKKKKGNHGEQSISQSQSSVQNALCASGETNFLSCNNVSFQNQKNTGNNALVQNEHSGNFADRAIGLHNPQAKQAT